jgi:hypothetical protein
LIIVGLMESHSSLFSQGQILAEGYPVGIVAAGTCQG